MRWLQLAQLCLLCSMLLPICCSCERSSAPSDLATASGTGSLASTLAATASAAVPSALPSGEARPPPALSSESSASEEEWDDDDGTSSETGKAAPSEAPSDDEPPDSTVEVKIENVGMRIAGGTNDKRSKEPIRKAISSQHGAIAACYRHAGDKKKKGGTFGLDFRIGGKGGKAKVRDVRTRLGDKEFRQCVVEAFEQVEFPKPPGGKPTVVSYSIRFVPVP